MGRIDEELLRKAGTYLPTLTLNEYILEALDRVDVNRVHPKRHLWRVERKGV